MTKTALLQMKALCTKLSMGRSTLYNLIKNSESNFPLAFAVMGGRSKYYIEHEIDEWIISQKNRYSEA